MKSLLKYLYEFEGATPMNTMGMGNPCCGGDVMSEPIGKIEDKKRTPKKKFLKNKSKE